jgi:Ca-activated chloride channel family protein
VTFQHPVLLLGLFVVAALVGLYLLAQRRRRKFTLRFTDVTLLQSVVARRPGVRKHVPPALFLLGSAGLVAATAQPVLNLEVARNDASVMLVIDTSGSMDATDIQPTRLGAAKSAAHNLISQLPPHARVGLVSFSTFPVLAAALTDNRDSVQSALDQLQVGGATATGDALALALKQLAPAAQSKSTALAPAMIVLLTDGSTNRGPDPQVAAAQAKAAGVTIQTVGVGSRNGTVLVQGLDVGGVDEHALQAIAGTTGGKYYFAEEAGRLSQIYVSLGAQFGWRLVRLDVTVPMILLGSLVILAGAVLSLVWFRVLP